MEESERRTRFEERVRIEREFLVPINQRFGFRVPLTGMTGAAILSWEKRAVEFAGAFFVSRLAQLLREAARRAELLADNSREVFTAENRAGADGLSTLRRMLEDELSQMP